MIRVLVVALKTPILHLPHLVISKIILVSDLCGRHFARLEIVLLRHCALQFAFLLAFAFRRTLLFRNFHIFKKLRTEERFRTCTHSTLRVITFAKRIIIIIIFERNACKGSTQ